MIPLHAACCPDLWYPPNSPDARPLRSDAVILTFSPEEYAAANSAAMDRMRVARALPHAGGEHRDGSELEKRKLAALGEIAVGRVLGYPFDPKPFGPDVGPYEVRTRREFDLELFIRRGDLLAKPHSPYVLVTCDPDMEVAIVRGWLTPLEASAHPEWIHDYGNYGRPAWFVPQIAIHDMRRLCP